MTHRSMVLIWFFVLMNFGCGSIATHNNEYLLTGGEMRDLHSGKTVISKSAIRSHQLITYYNPDGSLAQDRNGRFLMGRWWMDQEGKHCTHIDRVAKEHRCRIVTLTKGTYKRYLIKRKGGRKLVQTYQTIRPGDTHNLMSGWPKAMPQKALQAETTPQKVDIQTSIEAGISPSKSGPAPTDTRVDIEAKNGHVRSDTEKWDLAGSVYEAASILPYPGTFKKVSKEWKGRGRLYHKGVVLQDINPDVSNFTTKGNGYIKPEDNDVYILFKDSTFSLRGSIRMPLNMSTGWIDVSKGIVDAVINGRTIWLTGTAKVKIVDETTGSAIEIITYTFLKNASVTFNEKLKKLEWRNITTTRKFVNLNK